MKRILITGGAGFIGSTVGEYLLDKGVSVVAFDNLSRVGVESNLERLKKHLRFTFVRGNVCCAEELLALTASYDGVFHFAANTAVTTSFKDPEKANIGV